MARGTDLHSGADCCDDVLQTAQHGERNIVSDRPSDRRQPVLRGDTAVRCCVRSWGRDEATTPTPELQNDGLTSLPFDVGFSGLAGSSSSPSFFVSSSGGSLSKTVSTRTPCDARLRTGPPRSLYSAFSTAPTRVERATLSETTRDNHLAPRTVLHLHRRRSGGVVSRIRWAHRRTLTSLTPPCRT